MYSVYTFPKVFVGYGYSNNRNAKMLTTCTHSTQICITAISATPMNTRLRSFTRATYADTLL